VAGQAGWPARLGPHCHLLAQAETAIKIASGPGRTAGNIEIPRNKLGSTTANGPVVESALNMPPVSVQAPCDHIFGAQASCS